MKIQIKSLATNVKIKVEKLSAKPATVKEISGEIYQYYEITKTNLQDENIESVKIKFKVLKTWISDNDIDEATVALNRYVNDAWERLSTTKVNEDENFVYYEAETIGLSTFAITGEKKIPMEEVTTTTIPVTTTVPTATTTLPAMVPVAKEKWTWIGLVVVVLILIVLVIILKRKPQKKEEPKEKEPLI